MSKVETSDVSPGIECAQIFGSDLVTAKYVTAMMNIAVDMFSMAHKNFISTAKEDKPHSKSESERGNAKKDARNTATSSKLIELSKHNSSVKSFNKLLFVPNSLVLSQINSISLDWHYVLFRCKSLIFLILLLLFITLPRGAIDSIITSFFNMFFEPTRILSWFFYTQITLKFHRLHRENSIILKNGC